MKPILKKDKKMNIMPVNIAGSHKTATIDGLSVKKITEILGFGPNVLDDPDKVKYSWGFLVDGVQCGVWDYKGSHKVNVFSAYGDRIILKKVFGDEFVR